jgi:hypothetical protein
MQDCQCEVRSSRGCRAWHGIGERHWDGGMPQIFHRSFNTLIPVGLLGSVFLLPLLIGVLYALCQSPYVTGENITVLQEIPFSHEHHVGRLGFDCRYCHTSVEDSSFAGMPSTEVCMNCHSQIWVGSDMLRPVRESYRTGRPLQWRRVYNLPDFVYFDHSIHIAKGVGCVKCHGRVDRMPLLYQATPLTMSWCLDCHRDPVRDLRPRTEVFNLGWEPPSESQTYFRQLADEYAIREKTSCSTCHR